MSTFTSSPRILISKEGSTARPRPEEMRVRVGDRLRWEAETGGSLELAFAFAQGAVTIDPSFAGGGAGVSNHIVQARAQQVGRHTYIAKVTTPERVELEAAGVLIIDP